MACKGEFSDIGGALALCLTLFAPMSYEHLGGDLSVHDSGRIALLLFASTT
jgi:hypothetical protein